MNEKFNRVAVCLCDMFRHVRWAPQIRCEVLSLLSEISYCSFVDSSLLVTLWEIVPTVVLCRLLLETQIIALFGTQTTGFTLMILFFRRVKILRMKQCSKFPWLSSLISCGHNFSPYFSSVGVSHYHLIVPSVYLFVFHRYPKMCVGFHLVLRENTCVVVFHPALVCAFEVWRGRDQSTLVLGSVQRP